MPEEDAALAIRRLRWPVTLVSRVQSADPGGPGIIEVSTNPIVVRADVQPVGALTFWVTGAFEQTDTPITHRIFLRWVDYLDQTAAILRTTNLPGGGTRTETFRVRRIKELGGRKRFVCVECEMERKQ